MVTEVNAISEELNKQRTFEVVLISASAQEGVHGSNKGTRQGMHIKIKHVVYI